ncbi:F-box domain-containing protein [Mycena sanguinolenta]|uniref:F-box domain-containing protein n=1 Tax=Mycena sanguinolenta TaxID=230812 RepID=A0A8H6X7Q7_9AGAR|nr:F-box domain-containing protein [Mycena sanguinolenta]
MSTAASRAADRTRIAEIEANIFSLRRAILFLNNEKSRMLKRLNSYAYPVLTLPNEITSEIFINFIPAYPSPPPLKGTLSPTTLTHVCHQWREIALSTRALWCGILMPHSSDYDTSLPCLLESWLSRSGGLPLSISMKDMLNVIPEKAVSVLVRHRARWEYVALAVPSELIVLSMQGPMPLLRQFEVRPDNRWPLLSQPSPSPIRFYDVPRLRSVTLWEFHDPTGMFPWAQLTSLTMIYPSKLSAILRQAVNLIHCHLFLRADSQDLRDGIRLPALESLILAPYLDSVYTVDRPATDFLPALIAPALRTLQVHEGFLQPNPVRTIDSFLSRSGCSLRKLRITGDTRSVGEGMYRANFQHCIPHISFDLSLTDYQTSAKKLARRRYNIL